MSRNTARADASASSAAVVYQIGVAVDRCYDLDRGQTLVIEHLGDVSIEGLEQLEVKCYSDSLTDGHPNFWNTLTNWMDGKFDSDSFQCLVLYTTQPFSSETELVSWNEFDVEDRIALLTRINKRFEESYSRKKKKDIAAKPSGTLLQQRSMLDASARDKLLKVIDKVVIEANALEPSATYKKIMNVRLKGIPHENRDAYLQSLLGFVCRLNRRREDRWKITYDEFDEQLAVLNSTFGTLKRYFPKVQPAKEGLVSSSSCESLFVKKIHEIEHVKEVPQAILEYETMLHTVSNELKRHVVYMLELSEYQSQVLRSFQLKYEEECLSKLPNIKNSKAFYNRTIGAEAPIFRGFEDSPAWFRNGVLHMLMDDETGDCQWMLKDDS